MDKEFIVSVEDVFFKDQNSLYHIPPYQRGYKWTYSEVKTLLNDVDKFKPDGNKFYCLQNITLVTTSPNHYNVVDGQQRLTTLLVVLAYFYHNEQEKMNSLRERLSYDVREKTAEFIKIEVCSENYWNELKKERQESSEKTVENLFRDKYKDNEYDYRDIYHIFSASLAIVDFFKDSEKENSEKEKVLCEKFLQHVKLIKNVLWQAKESTIFNKVNGYKVPLDAADLIRAILITRVPIKQDKGFFSLDFLVSLNEKRTRIGLELDAINNWWQDSKRMTFFRRFIPNNFLNDSGKDLFQHEIYPIDILYTLYAIICGKENLSSLEFFEEKTANESDAFSTYQELLRTQKILQEWYDDPEIYHLIGVLWFFRNGQEKKTLLIKELYDKWHKIKMRSEFIKYLKSELRKVFTKTITDSDNKQKRVPDLELWLNRIYNTKEKNYDWYNDKNGMLQKVLILTDVILHIQDGNLLEPKFDKMAVSHFYTRGQGQDFYGGIQEDKEHIFPQTPINKDFRDNFQDYWRKCLPHAMGETNADILNDLWRKHFKEIESELSEEQRSQLRDEWCRIFAITNPAPDFIPDLGEVASDQEKIDNIAKNRTVGELLQPLINRFVFKVTGIYINSIGNIVLLFYRVNRGYGNDFFPEKRSAILRTFNEGNFIRLHTRRVFAKEGDGYSQEYNEWLKEDIVATAKNIRALIEKFFEDASMSPEEEQYQETAENSNEKGTNNDAE